MTHPYQEVYDTLFKIAVDLGYNTVSELPDPRDGQNLTMNFVYIGEQFGSDVHTKSAVLAEVNQTTHFYGQIGDRGAVTGQMIDFISEVRKLSHTKHYYVRISSIDQNIVKDTSTAVTLWHGIVDIKFKVY